MRFMASGSLSRFRHKHIPGIIMKVSRRIGASWNLVYVDVEKTIGGQS